MCIYMYRINNAFVPVINDISSCSARTHRTRGLIYKPMINITFNYQYRNIICHR